MDERVERAMQQWPDVPDVYGWLSLDMRGRWKLRGEPITNRNLIAFINRNYARTHEGDYAFQNGPQRVHVDLDATPWIALVEQRDHALQLHWHSGKVISQLDSAWMDPQGNVLLVSHGEVALLRDQDLITLLPCLSDESGDGVSDETIEAWLQGDDTPSIHLHLLDAQWELQRAPVRDEWQAFYRFQAKPRRDKA